MFKHLKKLWKKQEEACEAVEREVKRIYLPGCIVRFKRGRSTIEAEVIRTNSFQTDHRLCIRNIETDKEYFIGISPGHFPEIISWAESKPEAAV